MAKLEGRERPEQKNRRNRKQREGNNRSRTVCIEQKKWKRTANELL